eukprot:TRINITY_DN25_c0_g1_i1.p3 TRINITY_DN25_c0_g1~~TRINITY_DN25_c0_g1_i1.p3  ORF type:complete len:193 (+),score=93.43 TRINITY_DN25_c0_g1_i1:70-648(+)
MMRIACMLMMASTVSAIDYLNWKEMASLRYVSARLPTQYEGKATSEDECFKVVEAFPSPNKHAVYFNWELNLCQIYKLSAVGTYNGASKTMAWNDQTTEVEDHVHRMYVKKDDDKEEDSITDGGIIATIALAILFGACLVMCAFLCKEEHSDIANQLAALEKKELHMDEAASEEWERRSEAEEAKEADAAQK